MRIIVEDKFGHEISTSSWIDSAGTIRLVINNWCPKCDHMNITEEAEDLANRIVRDIRGGREVDPVIDLLG